MSNNGNRLDNAFSKKAFIGFITAGDPGIAETEKFVLALAEAGADVIEIGIPFSDPVADGPVIQAANLRALEKGTNTADVFNIVQNVRKKSEAPLVLLTYINPVYIYGYDAFFTKCNETGVDGVIIPDMPYEERDEVDVFAEKYGISVIPLIAPTSKDRVEMIAKEAKGFLYLVSSMGVTGVRQEIETDIKPVIEAVRRVSDIPVAVGFGISRPEQAAELSKYADGVIVGSKIVKIIEEHGDNAAEHLKTYVKEMKSALAD